MDISVPQPSQAIAITLNSVGSPITWVDIDDADLADSNWHLTKYGQYAAAIISGKTVFMHHVILERKLQRPIQNGMRCDHRDGNHLNNTKRNLREATDTQNAQNRKVRSDAQSGYKGVRCLQGLWQSRIMVDKKPIHLGYYETAEDAALVYDNAAMAHFGEFARTNYGIEYILSTPIPISPVSFKSTASGYRGVKLDHHCRNRWTARIKIDHQEIRVGIFPTAEEAARAYDRKALELKGDKAHLNFPKETYGSPA